MDESTRYLNKKPNAKNLTGAVQYTAFRSYFLGETLWKEYNDKAPEYAVRINNIDYAWIYKK